MSGEIPFDTSKLKPGETIEFHAQIPETDKKTGEVLPVDNLMKATRNQDGVLVITNLTVLERFLDGSLKLVNDWLDSDLRIK